jgi:hypothetical protein
MRQVCDYCGCEFDEEDSINCPNCGSVSTRTVKEDINFEII